MDMLKKENVYKILFCFLVCGILGWIFETIIVWIIIGHLTDRGILFLSRISNFPIVWGFPFILIYAIGGVILICGFKSLKNHPILLFLIGMVSMTIFELLSSYFCQYIMHKVYWDYSNEFMNFQGRISIRSAVVWGLLSLISVKMFSPLLDRLYNKLNAKKMFNLLIMILFIYIIICSILRPFMFPELI